MLDAVINLLLIHRDGWYATTIPILSGEENASNRMRVN